METNSSYCLNELDVAQSSTILGSNTSKGQAGCVMSEAPSGIICKDTSVSKNHSNKAGIDNRLLNGIRNNTNDSENYANFMQIPVESLQYHRRKLTPQEQTRMVCNTLDYRCQDDVFTATTNGRMGSAAILSSSQLESQPFFTSLGQQMQHHHQSTRHQQTHSLRNSVQQNYKSACMPHSLFNCNEEAFMCGERYESKDRLIAASTQTQCNENQISNNCEAITALSSAVTIDSSGGASATTVSSGHMMYTVHRVVTTAQIQTALGNTYASSSSVSSVVSALRHENDNLTTPTSISTSLTTMPGNGILGISGNVLSNMDENSNTTKSLLINAVDISDPQQSTGTGLLTKGAQKLNITSDHSRLQSTSCNNSVIMNGINGSKSASLIPRQLQNVIPTCVYLMSRIAVHMEIEGTSQCPTQVMLAAALGCEELGIANKLLAQSIFGLWMTSGLLDIQLKSHHRPYAVRVVWQSLLDKFSSGNPIEKKFDDPMIMLKRNVFFSKRDEEKIKDHRILELLYEEAKYNVLSGRYVMEPAHALMLGGIQTRIELGPYNSHTHTIGFLRENQLRFLPQHVARSTSWTWLPVSRKNSAEVKLLDQFKRVPLTATTKKLMRKYLEFCWALPFYGAAFFHGQIEQPVRGVMSLVSHKDVRVLIAVNERGIFVIDPLQCTLLLGLRYEDLSWDFAKPSVNNDPDCQTCIFIQFDALENGIQVSKLMQIFSKQANMIDALISHFTEQIQNLQIRGNTCDQHHSAYFWVLLETVNTAKPQLSQLTRPININDYSPPLLLSVAVARYRRNPLEPYPIQVNGNGVLCNKLWKLTLATFDEEGRCIGQTGNSLKRNIGAAMDLSAYQQLNIHMSTRGKRPLRNLTPNDKVRAIQRIHQGETKASVSRDIGVPESTLRGWCKNEQKLRFMCRQMNESNEFEQFPISKLENCQPAVKRNKLDTRNHFRSTNNMENSIDNNKMSYLNNCDFDMNNNSIYENALLEETLCEFLKNKALPDSNIIMKHNLVVKDKPISSRLLSSEKTLSSISSSTNYKRYNTSAHNLNYFLMLNSNFMPILHTSSISAQVGFSSEENYNNETINTSSYNKEGYDCNIFDINNNICQKSANNKNNECSDVSKLIYWYKIFNASLNFLALAAHAAILTGSDGDTTNIKLSQKDLEECIFETKGLNIQREFSNYSYYENEPEDLSIRSKVSTISTSNSKSSVSLKSITPSTSSQNDSDS